MKRWLVKIAVLLVLGAIVNVAVAWGCAIVGYIGPDESAAKGTAVAAPERWHVVERRDFRGTTWVGSHRVRDPRNTVTPAGDDPLDLVPYWSHLHDPVPAFEELLSVEARGRDIEYQSAYASGWPARTLWCRWHTVVVSQGVRVYVEPPSGLLPVSSRIDRMIPIYPVWPGFAINTVFYGAIAGMLFAVAAALRRKWRIWRGLCPACAYPVGESEACTECGQRVKETSP